MIKLLGLNLNKYFPILLNTIAYKPQTIVLSLTYLCNCRCLMCNYWKFARAGELTTAEVENILGQAKEMDVKSCILYGGEPLLRADIFELISYAHRMGMTAKIITNGLLIDKDKAIRLAQSGLDEISLSIDAASDLMGEFRGVKGAYQKALSALTELVNLREKDGIRVRIGALLMLPTLKDDNLLKVIELADKLKVSVYIQLLDFSLFYFKGVDEGVKRQLWITEDYQEELDIFVNKLIKIKKDKPGLIENSVTSLNYIKRYFKDPKSKDIPCYIAFSGRIWIDPQGKVYLCQGLPFIGDLRRERLKEIINSKRWREGIYNMFKKNCPGCSCMYSSNIDAHLPLAWQDILKKKLTIQK